VDSTGQYWTESEQIFALRFKNPEIAQGFKEAFDAAKMDVGDEASAPAIASNPLSLLAAQHSEGRWRCPNCAVPNDLAFLECICCEEPQPGKEKEVEAKKAAEAQAKQDIISSVMRPLMPAKAAAKASMTVTEHMLAQLEAQQGDVTLVLGEGDCQETLKAHYMFLCRAEYFESALKTEFQEGQTRRVELPDVCPKLMKKLVRALYSDEFDDAATDGVEKCSTDQLLSICKLADRFLVPDIVVKGAYDAFAHSVEQNCKTFEEHTKIFIELVGSRVPAPVMEKLIVCFRKGIKDCSLEKLLPAIIEAHSKDVTQSCQDVITSAILATVNFGNDMASSFVFLAKEGMTDLAEAVLDKIPKCSNPVRNVTSAVLQDFISNVSKERSDLHQKTEDLCRLMQLRLRLQFATKALPCLLANVTANVSYAKEYNGSNLLLDPKAYDVRTSSTIAANLAKDMEDCSKELFASIPEVVSANLEQMSQPEKRQSTA